MGRKNQVEIAMLFALLTVLPGEPVADPERRDGTGVTVWGAKRAGC
jgi:hypothetical protein